MSAQQELVVSAPSPARRSIRLHLGDDGVSAALSSSSPLGPPSTSPSSRLVTASGTPPSSLESKSAVERVRAAPRELEAPMDTTTTTAAREEPSNARYERRQRFLLWRERHPLLKERTPYGAVRFRLNTGLENPNTEHVTLDYDVSTNPHNGPKVDNGDDNNDNDGVAYSFPAEDVEANMSADEHSTTRPLSPTPRRGVSRVIGLDGGSQSAGTTRTTTPPPSSPPVHTSLSATSRQAGGRPLTSQPVQSGALAQPTGAVSGFLDTLEQYSQQGHRGRRRGPADRARLTEAAAAPFYSDSQQQQQQQRQSRRDRFGSHFLAQSTDGRLAEFKAGRQCGPSLVTVETPADTRRAAWRARQLTTLLQKENPVAPWDALDAVGRKVEEEKQRAAMGRMRRKEVAAYLRDAGRLTASFEKFEGEVTMAKYANEVRQTKTLRSQQQMHLNATAKINYRAMPPGLWKRYGEADSYWPTPRVLGRESDESHRPPK